MSIAAEANDSSLRPTMPHYAAAVGTLGVSLFLLTICPAYAFQEGDPFGYLALFFIVPIFLPLAWHQYRGTFLSIPRAATWAGRMLYGLAVFAAFGYLSNAGEGIVAERSLRPIVQMGPLAAIALVLAAAGRTNQLWSQRLQTAYAADPTLRPHRTTTLKQLLGGVTMAAVIFAATTYLLRQSGPRYAEHLPREAVGYHLPDDATDVCYARGVRGTRAYEFTTDEAHFRNWVQAYVATERSVRDDVQIEEINGTFGITRYVALAHELTGERRAEISDGLKFVHCYEDYGRLAAYDRTKRRAYFFLHLY